jgi:hypothetical protein
VDAGLASQARGDRHADGSSASRSISALPTSVGSTQEVPIDCELPRQGCEPDVIGPESSRGVRVEMEVRLLDPADVVVDESVMNDRR